MEVIGVSLAVFDSLRVLARLGARATIKPPKEFSEELDAMVDSFSDLLNEYRSFRQIYVELEFAASKDPRSIAAKTLEYQKEPMLKFESDIEKISYNFEIISSRIKRFDSSSFLRVPGPFRDFKETSILPEIKETKRWITHLLARLQMQKTTFVLALSTNSITTTAELDARLSEIHNILQENKEQKEEDSSRTFFNEKRDAVLNWFYPEPFDTKHIEIRERRQRNSGNWLLERPEFVGLVRGHAARHTLLGYGIAGAGKTFLSSVITDYFLAQAQKERYGVAYIYFEYKEQDRQTALHVLASLLKQLAQQIPHLVTEIEVLHEKLKPEGKRPTIEEIYIALLATFNSFERVFFIFDGLDECHAENQRVELLPLFERLRKNGASLFLTSRPDRADIESFFCDSGKVELSAKVEEIGNYIEAKIHENPRARRLVPEGKLKEKIISQLVDCSKGMFLLVDFHIDFLCQWTTTTKALNEIEKLKGSLNEARPLDLPYQRAIETIRRQPKDFQDLAMKVLSWLVKAQRTLTVREIQVAVSVDNRSELETPDLPDWETILDVCAGLVTIDGKNGTIRLTHHTVQEYLVKNSILPADADLQISMACITYLLFNTFTQGACRSLDSWHARSGEYAFLNYAATHLTFHLKQCDESLTTDLILKFLESPGNISTYLQACRPQNLWTSHLAASFDRYPTGRTSLHVASTLGHYTAVQTLIGKGIDISARDSEGRTALHLAALEGHKAVVHLLLDSGARVSVLDAGGCTPLHLAALRGHAAVALLLLENDADTTKMDRSGRRALSIAAFEGHEAVVRVLLQNGAYISARDKNTHWTALFAAVHAGHKAVVRLLIEKNADLSILDNSGSSVLHEAAYQGHTTIVELLLENGAAASTSDSNGRTALHVASSRGHEEVVRIFLAQGTNPSVTDEIGQTALHIAAFEGHESVVQLLADQTGAEISAQDTDGRTPLYLAASEGQEEVVRLLVNMGAETPIPQKDGRPALYVAASKGHEEVVRLLLKGGANISGTNKIGQTALHEAANQGHEQVVHLLLESGADPSIPDKYGRRVIHATAFSGNEEVVKLLIDKGVDTSVRDIHGKRAEDFALSEKHEEVAQLLRAARKKTRASGA